LIGAGERGRGVLANFIETGQVEVAAVCDIYPRMIDLAKSQAPHAVSFGDHRKLLEMKDLDVVQIAVPDHWHAAVAIDALNAARTCTWRSR